MREKQKRNSMGHKQTHLVIKPCMFVRLSVCLCESVPLCVCVCFFLSTCLSVHLCAFSYIQQAKGHDSRTIHPLLASTFLIQDLSLVKQVGLAGQHSPEIHPSHFTQNPDDKLAGHTSFCFTSYLRQHFIYVRLHSGPHTCNAATLLNYFHR